jgi:HSP20 family protein
MNELMVKNSGAATADAPHGGFTFTPRFDAWENENEFVLAGDLPGVAPEDLELAYENHELAIHARVAPRNPSMRPFCEEYGVGDFYRTFTLADSVDEAAISAELANGVLTVRLPKRAEVRPRKIQVKSSQTSS